MARIKLIEPEGAPPEVATVYGKMQARGARILNFYKALASSPPALPACLKLGNVLLSQADLSPRLRELVILRVADLAGSTYEWAQHVPVALAAGVSQEQIDGLPQWARSDRFSDEERAVLEYTDEVAGQVAVSDQTFETLERYLDQRRIVELTLSIGYWGMVARLLVPLQVEIDEQVVGSLEELSGSGDR